MTERFVSKSNDEPIIATRQEPSCKCERCDKDRQEDKPPVQFKKKNTTCFVCKKKVSEVLDLHHTKADICSLDCEKTYWLDIFS